MFQDNIITKATTDDAQSILEVQKLAFRSEAELLDNYKIPPLMQTIESIIEDFGTYDFFKITIKNKILGALKVKVLEGNILWIGRLIVHPDYQKQGLGRTLMKFIERKYNTVKGFELFTAQKSKRNIRFYQSLGYAIVDQFTEPGHADILLVKMTKERK
jgi:N-acetylglutamate synthase-like GNAT family acetyltransferase